MCILNTARHTHKIILDETAAQVLKVIVKQSNCGDLLVYTGCRLFALYAASPGEVLKYLKLWYYKFLNTLHLH